MEKKKKLTKKEREAEEIRLYDERELLIERNWLSSKRLDVPVLQRPKYDKQGEREDY